MTTNNLLFTSSDGSTLFATDGTTVTQLATSASTPEFVSERLALNPISAVVVGSDAYFTLANGSGAASAIWRYDGIAATQVTSSANYVNTTPDPNNATAPAPMVAFTGNLVFGEASLATGSDNGAYDRTTLALYNTTTGQISQFAAPNGGYNPQDYVVLGGTLYYEATDSTTQQEAIYSFNGTAITEIYNAHPTYFNSVYNASYQAAGTVTGPLVSFNGSLYFGSPQQTVYKLNSTASLSNNATNALPAAEYTYGNDAARDLIVYNNHLFFLSNNSGVWSLSTTGTSVPV